MADSGGHWLNLAEVQKLTQSTLLPGVIDESPKRGGIITELGMKQAPGQDLKWNRSNARRSGRRANIGAVLTWTDNVTYVQKTATLKMFYDQTPLNKFVRDVYGTINNYEAQQLLEIRTGIVETLEDAFVYDDSDYDTTHIEGLYHWAVDNSGDGDIDGGETALTFANWRALTDFMKYGISFYLMAYSLARFIDQFYQESGPAVSNLSTVGSFIWAPGDAGRPVPFWNGTPIRRTDYLVSEEPNTGHGSDARAKNSGGTAVYSILGIKSGVGGDMDPGLNIGFGGENNGEGELFRPTRFETLEDFDAAGLRMTSYVALMAGSALSVTKIDDLTLAVPTA